MELSHVKYTKEDMAKAMNNETKIYTALNCKLHNVDVEVHLQNMANINNFTMNTAIDVTNSIVKLCEPELSKIVQMSASRMN